MANLSQLVLPIKDESTGQITAQTFNIKDYHSVKTATLTAGSTSVTFTNLPSDGDNYGIEILTETDRNLDYNWMSLSGTTLTVAYDAQSSNVTVYCVLRRI